jgi:hypothetical protein
MIIDDRLNTAIDDLTPAERSAVDALIRQTPNLSRQARQLQRATIQKLKARLKRAARRGRPPRKENGAEPTAPSINFQISKGPKV